MYGTVKNVLLLVFVDAVYRLEQIGGLASPLKLVDERLNVFAKTASARAVADIGTPFADAGIGRDPHFQVFHENVGEGFGQPCPHPIPIGDVG